MEQTDLLDPLNEMHLYALHYVYIPRINKALFEFMQGWNNHPNRTSHNKSPHQLFTAGALLLQHSGLVALDFFNVVDDTYGIDVAESLYHEHSNVIVPEVAFSLSLEHFEDLKQTVNPLAASEDFGIDLYEQVLLYT